MFLRRSGSDVLRDYTPMDVGTAFPTTVSRDFFYLFAGKLLGSGIGRNVYEFAPDPKRWVIKVENATKSFQNIHEWEFWTCNEYAKDIAKWLAPCEMISPCGIVLLQRRADPITEKRMPKMIPTWATDDKCENWGLIDGKPVMVDYGFVLFNPPRTLKKRRSREEES